MNNIFSKKPLVVFIICALLAGTLILPINGNPLSNEYGTEYLSYTFSFNAPKVGTISTGSTNFITIDVPGCMGGQKLGQPTLPKKFVQLLLPPLKTVDCVTVTGSPVELKFSSSDLTNIYSSYDIYPTPLYCDYNIGYARGYSILSIGVQPVQLNQAVGQIYFYPELTVTVSLSNNGYLNPLFRNTPEDEAWVKSLVCNPEITKRYSDLQTFEYPGGLCDPSEKYDYVIITTEQNSLDYWDTSEYTPYNWESLMQKHVDEGLSCTLVTKQDIDACSDYYTPLTLFNDSQAHIREFCRDAYEDWHTRYVLIGADAEFIGARLMDYAYENDVDSDIYWSNLDNTFNADNDNYWGEEDDAGFDSYSELFLGRVTCDTPQDVSNWLSKSFYYADTTNSDYLENAGFYAGSGGAPGPVEMDDFIDFAAIKGTDNWLGPDPDYQGPWPNWLGFLFGFETWNMDSKHEFDLSIRMTTCTPNPGWNQGGAEEFRNAINNNSVTLITGIGHGDPAMSLDVYDSEWESSYHNTMPFFISDLSSHCGDMDAEDDGVLDSMLFHSDTNLAFGCLFNSGYSWVGNQYCTNSSDALQTKLFWDYFFDVLNNSGSCLNWQFGKGLAWSKDKLAPTLNWDPSWRGTIEDRLLFADPAQSLRLPNNPPTIDVISWSPDSGLTLKAIDPEGDDVFYMVDWGDGTTTQWAGPYQSNEEITMNHTWSSPGVYTVKARAKDIYNAISDWSDPIQVQIPEYKISIESISGILGVTVKIKNTGSGNLSNVGWNINLDGRIILLGKSKSGVIDTLSIGESKTVNNFVLGLGSTMISVNATSAQYATADKNATCFVIGVFTFSYSS